MALRLSIQARVLAILERLTKWPAVSRAKPLRHDLRGNFRIRTGKYRVVFSVNAEDRTISGWNIDDRKDVFR